MRLTLFLLTLFVSSSAFAQEDFASEFLLGKYLLVGKGLDTDVTYTGKVEIYREGGKLKLKRVIHGTTIIGSAALEPAAGGDTQVLRFRYEEAGMKYEQTCLWQSDLDNYARISCHLYRPDVRTLNPGLEVLFHTHE